MGDYTEVARLLPSKISLAIKEPPICDVVKVVPKGRLVIFLQAELMKLTERISVGNTINAAQLEFISTQLIEYFPGESLADFKICFERGCMGQYGEIFRMDGIVIRKWMEQYLEEKYTIVEEELKKSPDSSMYKPAEVKTHDERHSEHLANWLKAVGDTGYKVPGMTDEEIKKNGKEEPPKRSAHTAGYTYFKVGDVEVFASTQEHAEELHALMIKNKLIRS
jgi:hypothetical protein